MALDTMDTMADTDMDSQAVSDFQVDKDVVTAIKS